MIENIAGMPEEAVGARAGSEGESVTAAPQTDGHRVSELVEAELLVEDVSIDGMCGVY